MINAQEFLQGLYGPDTSLGGCTAVARHNTVGFGCWSAFGDQNNAPPWPDSPDDGAAWYACVSKLRREDIFPRLTRKNEKVVAIHVVMLDDIGTKSKPPELPPSAVLETSAGNFQWIYRLTEPETNVAYYDAVMDALAALNYTDSGAKGAVRLYRIPGSVNHKDNKGAFVTRCTVWNPEITYTLRELADALHVVPVGSDDTSPQDELVHGEIHAGRDALGLTEQRWVEKMVMKHHPLLAAMTAMGHVYSVDKKPCRNPIYIVKCPNSHNHSDPSDDKAKLQITTGQAKASWFFCHHAHCQGLGYKDLLEAYAGFGVKPDCDFDWLLKKNLAQYAMVGTRIRDIFHTADRPATDPTYDPEVFRNMWKRHQKILNIDGANGKKKQIVIQMYDSWLKGCDAYTGEIFRPDLPDLCVAGQLNTHRMSYRFPSGRPEPRHVDLLKELVYGLVNQDERTAEWLLKWISIKLSHLEARLPGVIFFSETQGHGKTTLGSVVRVVLGANYVVQTFGKMVAPGARFNKCQETAAILELNEVHPPHGHATPGVRRAIYSHLKRLNDPTIDGVVEIEGKGVDSKMAKAFSSVWIMGNDKYEPAIDPNDRRYTAIETVKFAPEGHRIWRDLERELTINRVPFGNSLYNWAVANSEGQRSIEVLDTPYLRELKARGFGDEVTDKAEEIANEFKTLSAKIGG